ncbi:hypothetical protein Tco_1056280 [Tanacetum coccineum]|uniref:Reverse transcriptase zinc-binding domain-containing protein n=1 Tax=Tanacetum coccineum TaxID=301880 RepID=A0ABQ5H4E8_9ASTR
MAVPLVKFNIHRGLCHGVPLFSFSLIIAMEGLHVAMEDAMTLYSLEIGREITSKVWSQFLSSLYWPRVVERIGISVQFDLWLPIECNMATFLNNPHALWTRLIVAIHGPNEDSSSFFSHIKGKGVWNRIVGSINSMHEKGFIPHSSILRRVNNGTSTRFWHDTWTGTSSLKHQYPRLFHLALNKDCLVRDSWKTMGCILNGLSQYLKRILGSGPLDRLPSRWNLSRRGIEVASITCPICDNGIDTSYHSLWVCSLATTVWIRVFNWLDLHPPSIPNFTCWYTGLDDPSYVF